MKRRTALTTGVGAVTALTSGCGAYDFSAHRSLSPIRTSVEQSNSNWILNTSVNAEANGFVDPAKEAFHDVVLLVYSEAWNLISSKEVGDITDIAGAEIVPVTVTCPEFPYHLTFDATESPCDPNTVIRIATYDGTFENTGRIWPADRRRKCGEGLPPGPES